MKLLARLACLPAVLLFAACTTTAEPAWITGTVEAPNERILWDVIATALEKSDFPLGAGMDPGKRIAQSGWRNSLQPFRGQGYRQRCEIHYEEIGERQFFLQLRVQRDKNMDIIKPHDLTYAEWEADADQPDRARVVLQYIRSMLGPGTGQITPVAKPPSP